jgi:hypothetical protein
MGQEAVVGGVQVGLAATRRRRSSGCCRRCRRRARRCRHRSPGRRPFPSPPRCACRPRPPGSFHSTIRYAHWPGLTAGWVSAAGDARRASSLAVRTTGAESGRSPPPSADGAVLRGRCSSLGAFLVGRRGQRAVAEFTKPGQAPRGGGFDHADRAAEHLGGVHLPGSPSNLRQRGSSRSSAACSRSSPAATAGPARRELRELGDPFVRRRPPPPVRRLHTRARTGAGKR